MLGHGKLSYILFFYLLVFVNGWRSRKDRNRRTSTQFDVLIFTQRWPQTVCYLWKENSPSHSCSLPKDDEWTIHGIWPSIYHELGPQFCNQSLPFNATALKPLENELRDKWIDVQNGREPYSFWQHEWLKHGTCAVVLEQFNSEIKYFKQGLDLLNKYSMKDVLEKANILPGETYAVGDIFTAIEKVLGKRGEIMCVKNEETGESYIFEIRICFDKALQLIDCDEVFGYPTNCRHSKRITYPGGVPHTRQYHVVQV